MPTEGAQLHKRKHSTKTQDNPSYGIAHYNLKPLKTAVIQTFRKRPQCNNTAVFLSVTPTENKQTKL